VTRLSWGGWDPNAWQTMDLSPALRCTADGGKPGVRRLAGVITNATVFLEGAEVGCHEGGYLPWSVELTRRIHEASNVLAAVVDARRLDVVRVGPPRPATRWRSSGRTRTTSASEHAATDPPPISALSPATWPCVLVAEHNSVPRRG
jgi:hypothetical protein